MAPEASAFVTLSIQLGCSISSAVVVTLLDRRQRFRSSALAGGATHTAVAHAGRGGAASLFWLLQNQAYVLAYADISYLVAALSFALIPCVFIVRGPPVGEPLQAASE